MLTQFGIIGMAIQPLLHERLRGGRYRQPAQRLPVGLAGGRSLDRSLAAETLQVLEPRQTFHTGRRIIGQRLRKCELGMIILWIGCHDTGKPGPGLIPFGRNACHGLVIFHRKRMRRLTAIEQLLVPLHRLRVMPGCGKGTHLRQVGCRDGTLVQQVTQAVGGRTAGRNLLEVAQRIGCRFPVADRRLVFALYLQDIRRIRRHALGILQGLTGIVILLLLKPEPGLLQQDLPWRRRPARSLGTGHGRGGLLRARQWHRHQHGHATAGKQAGRKGKDVASVHAHDFCLSSCSCRRRNSACRNRARTSTATTSRHPNSPTTITRTGWLCIYQSGMSHIGSVPTV